MKLKNQQIKIYRTLRLYSANGKARKKGGELIYGKEMEKSRSKPCMEI